MIVKHFVYLDGIEVVVNSFTQLSLAEPTFSEFFDCDVIAHILVPHSFRLLNNKPRI